MIQVLYECLNGKMICSGQSYKTCFLRQHSILPFFAIKLDHFIIYEFIIHVTNTQAYLQILEKKVFSGYATDSFKKCTSATYNENEKDIIIFCTKHT